MKVLSLFLPLVFIFTGSESKAVCKYEKYTPAHTFCKPPNKQCSMLTKGLTPEDRKTILGLHNTLRSKVAQGKESRGNQPQAANMMQMVWDNSLEEVAQKMAEQCTFAHDCNACRKVDAFSSVGQNLYITYGSGDMKANWPKAVNSWYDEVRSFSKSNINPFQFTSGTGHYTQVVWGDTKAVGCGIAKYKSARPGFNIEQLYVCNYGPAGNFIGSSLYVVGSPGSRCPKGSKRSSEYAGLCISS